MGDFSHLGEKNEAKMVDVGDKKSSLRQAATRSQVIISPSCVAQLTDAMIAEIATAARIAGIQATKRTWELIPLCHSISLSGCEFYVKLDRANCTFDIEAVCRSYGPTGVEMEALTGAAVAALTIYDMIKAVDPSASITDLHLVQKTGGKNGPWIRRTQNTN